jgi:FkbM family methyltransferase
MARIPKLVLKVLRPMNYYRFLLWRLKKFQISFHSKILNRRLYNSDKKGLFLDCGSNVGQGFEFFRRYYPSNVFDYVLFEPNPYCFQELVRKYSNLANQGVRLMNVAVGIDEREIDFYGLEEEKGGIYSVGGTVLLEHNSKKYTVPKSASLQVSSINFPDFLREEIHSNAYSVVILKLDIEGGEYIVLDSLISNNLVSSFETIYVEFHSQYMSSEIAKNYRNKEKAFLKYAKRTRTRVINWI